jgi:hypothetical protein
MSLMTIFISPKGFQRPHIALIQKNAVRSWKQLGTDVDIVLIGDDEGVGQAAADLGVRYIADVKRNDSGTPLLSDIFQLARETSTSPLLAYVNADILLFPDFLAQAERVLAQKNHFLMVGQRWDLDVQTEIDFEGDWQSWLKDEIKERGRRHPPSGSDYFIYPRSCFEQIPDFAIGRSGWDNWMLYEARQRHWPLIDCSDAIDIVHQDHDYQHLPNGQSHYRLPESKTNVELAGGKRCIFTLRDCNRRLTREGKIERQPFSFGRLSRELEIFPSVTLHSKALDNLAYALFHPKKWYGDRLAKSRQRKESS